MKALPNQAKNLTHTKNVCPSNNRITARIDDDMIRYYTDEDSFLLEVVHSRLTPEQQQERSNCNGGGSPSDPNDVLEPGYDVTLVEMPRNHHLTLGCTSPHQAAVVQQHVTATWAAIEFHPWNLLDYCHALREQEESKTFTKIELCLPILSLWRKVQNLVHWEMVRKKIRFIVMPWNWLSWI